MQPILYVQHSESTDSIERAHLSDGCLPEWPPQCGGVSTHTPPNQCQYQG